MRHAISSALGHSRPERRGHCLCLGGCSSRVVRGFALVREEGIGDEWAGGTTPRRACGRCSSSVWSPAGETLVEGGGGLLHPGAAGPAVSGARGQDSAAHVRRCHSLDASSRNTSERPQDPPVGGRAGCGRFGRGERRSVDNSLNWVVGQFEFRSH